MVRNILDNKELVKESSPDELLNKLSSSEDGLSTSEVEKRLEKYGLNEISEKSVNPIIKFLRYFWGPIPWMIEIAIIISAIIGHYTDLGIITALLLLNAVVGFGRNTRPIMPLNF